MSQPVSPRRPPNSQNLKASHRRRLQVLDHLRHLTRRSHWGWGWPPLASWPERTALPRPLCVLLSSHTSVQCEQRSPQRVLPRTQAGQRSLRVFLRSCCGYSRKHAFTIEKSLAHMTLNMHAVLRCVQSPGALETPQNSFYPTTPG